MLFRNKHSETELIIPQTLSYFTTSLHNDIKTLTETNISESKYAKLRGTVFYNINHKTHQIMCNFRVLTEDEENQIVLDTRYITVNRIPIKGHYNPHECCCKVQLKGRWIDKCGFKPNDKLTVSVYRNRLVIEKAKTQYNKTLKYRHVSRKANEKYVRERVRQLVSPAHIQTTKLQNGEIKWIK